MYKFTPILKTMVWGTENWVLSGVPGNESVVAEGPEKGKKITEIWPGQFPLLIKFIDAHKDLSIQVHPNDELAAVRHNCKGKTEMWYVIGAGEGAHLLSGLKEQIDADKYVELVQQDKIVDVLADYPVKPGDVFFLPAGRIHAIGGGCYIAEIQQTSDITYRIYDYGRLGLDGKPRELHTEQAKDAIDFSVKPDYRTGYCKSVNRESLLVKCPYFTTSLYDLTEPVTKDLHNIDSFLVAICIEGEGSITTVETKPKQVIKAFGRTRVSKETVTIEETISVRQGTTVLIPASAGSVTFSPAGNMTLLTSYIA